MIGETKAARPKAIPEDLFVDVHTHGLGSLDTRSGQPEAVIGLAESHRRKGTALIYPTIYPSGLGAMRAQMSAVKEAMGRCGLIGGINLEGPFLNPARAGALGGGNFWEPSLSNLRELIGGFEDVVKIITIAPELPGALKLIEKCAGLGIRVNMGHSDADIKAAREGKRAGATGVTHLFNAMRPFHHREPGLAGFALLDEDIYVEVIADAVHLAPETLALVLKVKDPQRIIIVSDSVRGGAGKPVFENGALAGGGKTISECISTMRKIFPRLGTKQVKLFGRDNALRYLGF